MILIVLAALGVPLWLVAGALVLTLRSRRRFTHRADVFPCRLRLAGPSENGGGWPRGKRYAYWVHDVLLGRLVDEATHHDDVALATGPFVPASLM